MRTTIIGMAIVAMLAGWAAPAHAQFSPKAFQPSLPAAAKTEKRKAPPLKAVPDLKSTLYKMADALGMLRGQDEEDAVLTVHFWGSGTMIVNGQAYTVENYRGDVRFDVPGMRADYTLVGADGRKRRRIEVVAGGYAWDEADRGVKATPAPMAVTERLARLWALPHAVVKAAVKAGTAAKVTLENGVLYVTFPLPAPLAGTARVALNTTDVTILTMDNGKQYELTNLVDRVEMRVASLVTETTYSNYDDWNEADYKSDVQFPGRIVQRRNGVATLDLTVTKTNTYNPYVVMPVPENVRKAMGQR
jgi:hypothetical protein